MTASDTAAGGCGGGIDCRDYSDDLDCVPPRPRALKVLERIDGGIGVLMSAADDIMTYVRRGERGGDGGWVWQSPRG